MSDEPKPESEVTETPPLPRKSLTLEELMDGVKKDNDRSIALGDTPESPRSQPSDKPPKPQQS